MDRAHAASITMMRLMKELDEIRKDGGITAIERCPDAYLMVLATIPNPKFSGRIWGWDMFWEAFEHSVDSRQIDDLYKMSYLLDELQGEAKESAKYLV